MVKAAPASVPSATRRVLAALSCLAALAGCGPDRSMSEQVAEANAAAERAESARKAAESALKRLEAQRSSSPPVHSEPVIDNDADMPPADAPMDNAEPSIDPAQDAYE